MFLGKDMLCAKIITPTNHPFLWSTITEFVGCHRIEVNQASIVCWDVTRFKMLLSSLNAEESIISLNFYIADKYPCFFM